jgi:hypothetical protein
MIKDSGSSREQDNEPSQNVRNSVAKQLMLSQGELGSMELVSPMVKGIRILFVQSRLNTSFINLLGSCNALRH